MKAGQKITLNIRSSEADGRRILLSEFLEQLHSVMALRQDYPFPATLALYHLIAASNSSRKRTAIRRVSLGVPFHRCECLGLEMER